MQLFFNASLNESSSLFQFEKEESRHIVKVLRKTAGDTLNITNGKGWMFEAEILDAHIKGVQAQIISKIHQSPPPYHLHMAVAPTKSMDRYEWFLEKVTEIGISEITPIICDNSERKVVKSERLERIILSAAKQSLKSYVPLLNEPVSFNQFISKFASSDKYIAHCEEGTKQSLFTVTQPNADLVILIGPEGDFSPKEIEMALDKNFRPVSLGDARLRTETAAIAACHTVALVNSKN